MTRQIIFLLSFLMTTPVFAAEKMTLLLDWFVNPDHAPIIVAREKGFFADQGLEVEVIAPADPSDPPKLVAAGKAEPMGLPKVFQPGPSEAYSGNAVALGFSEVSQPGIWGECYGLELPQSFQT